MTGEEVPELFPELDDPGPPLIHEQGETEGDLETHDPKDFQAAVSATDWTVETLVNQMRKGRINLNPRFQRRNAWLDHRKSQLIESLVLRYPVPQLVLAENHHAPGTYFVIDGKQRLLSLRQFWADPTDPRDMNFEPLTLRGLEILEDLNGMTWSQVEDQRPELSARYENQTIRTVVISNWTSHDLLLSMFLRLNTGSVVLSPQELRQALLPGDFVDWIDDRSASSFELMSLLGNAAPDRRMIDAELLLRFIALGEPVQQYRGNLKRFLDDTCRGLNNAWDTEAPRLEHAAQRMEQGIRAGFELFESAGFCRKWSKGRFERPFNRALFDVQVSSLAHPDVAQAAVANRDAVIDAYRRLCENDAAFVQSISTTTKTVQAFRTRFAGWNSVLFEAAGVQADMPAAIPQYS